MSLLDDDLTIEDDTLNDSGSVQDSSKDNIENTQSDGLRSRSNRGSVHQTDQIVGHAIRAQTQTVINALNPQTNKKFRWSSAGLFSSLTIMLLISIAALVISILAVIKPALQNLLVSQIPVSFADGVGLIVNQNLNVSDKVTVGTLNVSGNCNIGGVGTSTNVYTPNPFQIVNSTFSPQIITSLNVRQQYIQISSIPGVQLTSTIQTGSAINRISAYDLFSQVPLSKIIGDSSLYQVNSNKSNSSFAFLQLPTGYWNITVQCLAGQTDNIGNPVLTLGIPLFASDMASISFPPLFNVPPTTSTSLITSQSFQNSFQSSQQPRLFSLSFLTPIPLYQNSNTLNLQPNRPSLVMYATNFTSAESFFIFNISMTCVRMA